LTKPPEAARKLPHGRDLTLIRRVRGMRPSCESRDDQLRDDQLIAGIKVTVVVRPVPALIPDVARQWHGQ
jgi:hypothetical protein